MTRAARLIGASLLMALSLCAEAHIAHAADPFEIQVYDGTANGPGNFGVELHVNHVGSGIRSASPPELPMHGVTHFTVEPSLGITNWWEIGGYLQSALRADGHFDYAGVKLRSKFVTVPSFHANLRIGVNLELSLLPEAYEPDRWGGEIRPIAAWENEHWIFSVNPIMGIPLAGAGFSDGPSFEPAAMVLHKFAHLIDVGFEYYAGLGPIANPSPLHGQQHYIYEVFNLLSVDHFELNLGMGEGLTASSNHLVFKMIMGWAFEPAAPRPGPSQ